MGLQLATYAVSNQNHNLLEFLLRLVNKKTPVNWQLSREEQADAVVVDVDNAQGLRFWQDYRHQRALIALSWYEMYRPHLYLEKPLKQPQPLIELLNTLTQEAKYCTSVQFNPSLYLPGLIQTTFANSQPCSYSYSGEHFLYIYPEKNLCLVKPQVLGKYHPFHVLPYGAKSREITVTDISPSLFYSLHQSDYFVNADLDTILWLSILQSSQGRLLAGYDQAMPVHLKHWPNFANLPYQDEHIHLAAHLLKNTTTLETAAKKTQIALDKVIDFFNACAALGLMQVEQRERLQTAPAKPSNPSLFKKIYNACGILKKM